MAVGSPRRSIAGPFILAVIFLAVIGAGAGFSLGTLYRHTQPTSQSSSDGTGGTGATVPSSTPADPSPSARRCPSHTEQQAHVAPLYQVLYLHTQDSHQRDLSEVWVCKSTDGTLFYQGHSIRNSIDEDLVEGKNALFLSTIEPEADNGWVATNTDQNGNVTKYHVKPHKLIIEYVWKGTVDEQDAV